MPKEYMYYSCIACITIDSVMNFNGKNHLKVCLEECKYRIKKTQMPKFIKNELKSDSDLDSDLDSDDKKLMVKLKKSDPDFDYDSDLDSEVESKSGAKLMAKLKKFHSDSEKNLIKIYLQH